MSNASTITDAKKVKMFVPVKQQQNRMLPPSDAEQSCHVYNHAAYIYPEWTLIHSGSINTFYSNIEICPPLHSKFISKQFKVSDNIINFNAAIITQTQEKYNLKTLPNPAKLLFNIYSVPSNTNDSQNLCAEYFEDCAHPSCVISKTKTTSLVCTFQFKWKILCGSPNIVRFYVKGKHCLEFVPTFKYWRKSSALKYQVIQQLHAHSKPRSVKQTLDAVAFATAHPAVGNRLAINTVVNRLSSKQISNIKAYNNKSSQSFNDDFAAAKHDLIMHEKSGDIVIFTPKEIFDESTPSNFIWAIGYPHLLRVAISTSAMYAVCGYDGVFKIMENRTPIYVLCSVYKYKAIPLMIALMCNSKGTSVAKPLQWFQMYILANTKTLWKPVLMTDAGLSEQYACKIVDFVNVICFFHFKKAVLKELKSKVQDVEERNAIWEIVNEMAHCDNMIALKQLCKKLQQYTMRTKNENIYSYFEKQWFDNAEAWTNINRPVSVGLGFTNNYVEAIIKTLENFNGTLYSQKRTNIVVDNIIKFFRDRHLSIDEQNISKSAKEALVKLETAKQLQPFEIQACNKRITWKFQTDEQKEPYSINLIKDGCSCKNYQTTHHDCKHIYYCMLRYAHEFQIKQLLNTCDPYLLKETVLQHIFFPDSVHSYATNYDNPNKKPVDKVSLQLPYETALYKSTEIAEYRKQRREVHQNQIISSEHNAQEEFIVTEVLGVYANSRMKVIWQGKTTASDDAVLDLQCEALHKFVIKLRKVLAPMMSEVLQSNEQITQQVKSVNYLPKNDVFMIAFSNDKQMRLVSNIAMAVYHFMAALKLWSIVEMEHM